MTDKQIIIDGVDVSGCDCYCDGKCLCEYNEINRKIIRYYSCNKFPNCYYKQLKAKEQECETLASQLDFEVQKKECLEQECEELKKIINEAKNSKLDLKSFLVGEAIQNEYEQQLDQLKAENDNIKETFDGLFKVQYKLADNNKKLRQCLTEIKVLSENVYCLTNALNRDMALFAKEILQKISEVEE